MDNNTIKKVPIPKLMQIAVRKYNMDNDITFSQQAIEKYMRGIFCNENSPYNSYIEKVPGKDRKDNFGYNIAVTDETINLVTNLIVLYNMVGPTILKGLIFENEFKKDIFNERINKIKSDTRQLELLAVSQDILYKLFEEKSSVKLPFADFLKSNNIIGELVSSKISSSKHLSSEDIQLLLYPNKINIENDKDRLIRDIELSLHNNQFSVSEEIINESLLKYPDEIILYYLKFKLYYKVERLATENFNREYLTEDNMLDHPELLDIFRDDDFKYRNQIIDILLKILELWPEDERKYRPIKYKNIDYDEILYYLIKYRNMMPAGYKVIKSDKEVDTSCYTEQFFKDSYELYQKECELYDNGDISYSYEEFKRNNLNRFRDKHISIFGLDSYTRVPFAGHKYEVSEKDKKILSYIKTTDSIYDTPRQVTQYDMLELFRTTSPEKYYEYLKLWKEQFNNIQIDDNHKPSPFYFIEKVLSGYHEYHGEFLYGGDKYFRDAFEPEELKSLLKNMKTKYIEYIEKIFSVSYTRFYITQKCIHVEDFDYDGYDYESDFYHD